MIEFLYNCIRIYIISIDKKYNIHTISILVAWGRSD